VGVTLTGTLDNQVAMVTQPGFKVSSSSFMKLVEIKLTDTRFLNR